jgi:cytochrome b6-f complex iron-sulfur subunit
MNRRDLIQRVLVGGTVLVLAPSLIDSCTKDSSTNPDGGDPKPTKVDLDLTLPANSVLNNDGGSLIVQNIIVINTGSSTYSALSSICTHQGCTVGYNSGAGNIQCPCHGSVYATSGSVINGPAPQALKSYPVKLTGNILTITVT